MITRRGTIAAWTAGTYLADIRLLESAAQTLQSVPVNRAILSADMALGRIVVVDMGPNDRSPIVLAVIG